MEEILLVMHPDNWELIKSGKKTIEIRQNKPKKIFYPFRAIVYITGEKKVVGKFDCCAIETTIMPETLAKQSCMTEKEIRQFAGGKSICGWYIKDGSVVEYERAFTLIEATGLSRHPNSWCYLNRVEQDG